MAQRQESIKIVYFLILVFLICSCSGNRTTLNENIANDPNSGTSGVEASTDEGEAIIKLKTAGPQCNLCASYEVLVFANRKVIIEREYFEERPDERCDKYAKARSTEVVRITDPQLDQLIGKLEEIEFFELAERYLPGIGCPQGLSHGQIYDIYYRRENRSKTVRHYKSCESSDNSKKFLNLRRWLKECFGYRTG